MVTIPAMEASGDDYTGEDLRRFRAVLRALEAGAEVDTGVSLPFVVRGWLEVVHDEPGLRLTELGRSIVE